MRTAQVLAAAIWFGPWWLGAATDAALDSWRSVNPPSTTASVAFGNGVFVGYSDYGSLASSDGLAWVKPALGGGVRPLVYGGGWFLSRPYDSPEVVTSTNGLKWDSYLDGTSYFSALAYGRARYVAVGPFGKVGMSTDGIHWTNWVADTNWFIVSVTFGRGLFMAGGATVSPAGTAVWTSTDGVGWELHSLPGLELVADLAYGRGRFVGVAEDNKLWTSSDGREWHRSLAAVPTDQVLWAAAFGNGTFLCTGYGGAIWSSSDGETWEQRQSGVTSGVGGAAFGKGKFVAGGEHVLVSGVMSPHVAFAAFRLGETLRLEDGAMLLTIEAPYGREVVVEASEDLATWKQIARDPCDRGEFEVYDEAAKDLKHRYYRARQAAP